MVTATTAQQTNHFDIQEMNATPQCIRYFFPLFSKRNVLIRILGIGRCCGYQQQQQQQNNMYFVVKCL